MMERARTLHQYFFKGRLVIPTTSEFPQCSPPEQQMCSLYLMTLLRQKATGKQIEWGSLREFCFDEKNLTYLRKLISNDLR